jgi:hypothetical protein
MNQLDNVERRDTSGHDKTSGNSFRDQQEYADCVRRQLQAYDESDLAGDVDDVVLDHVKNGRYEEAGMAMFSLMNKTVASRVRQEGWK